MAGDFKCPQCGNQLEYDPRSGYLHCVYCRGYFSFNGKENGIHEGNSFSDFNLDAARDGRELFQNAHGYRCSMCDAEVIAEDMSVSASCPYCNSQIILDDRISRGLEPDLIIPFSVSKEDLPKILIDYYQARRFLLPRGFFDECKIASHSQGIYVPFWLFDSDVNCSVIFRCETGEDSYINDYAVSGSLSFRGMPVDASSHMDDSAMDCIDPYDYSQAVKFKPEYLAGFLAERFDMEPTDLSPRAHNRFSQAITEKFAEIAKRSSGYRCFEPLDMDMRTNDTGVSYAFLPVYIYNAEYHGKQYRYYINGQTGKVIGDIPIDKWKSFLLHSPAGIIIAIFAFTVFVNLFTVNIIPGVSDYINAIMLPILSIIFVAIVLAIIKMRGLSHNVSTNILERYILPDSINITECGRRGGLMNALKKIFD